MKVRKVIFAAAIGQIAALSCASPPEALSWKKPDPTQEEVFLPAASGWKASLVHDPGVGIWTVAALKIFESLGCPEVVGMDDKGRFTILTSYSGKWTPYETIFDGKWLGGLAHVDVDPRKPGKELYTGSQRGNLYQIWPHPHQAFDTSVIAFLPGLEIHTIVAGDLDPARTGNEILVFTRPGRLFLVTANPQAPSGFDTTLLQEIQGRIREALVLPAKPGEAPEIATVSVAGKFELLRLTPTGPQWRTVSERPMGMGRIAMRPHRDGDPLTLYTSCDDGIVLRHERGAAGTWKSETIYAGPQGPRGVAAGRFHEDPAKETIAVFGYGKEVHVLTREPSGWIVESVFTDRDKGHWLSAAELDGRNGTDEILASGYGGRIVLISRPPGYGISKHIPTAPKPAQSSLGGNP